MKKTVFLLIMILVVSLCGCGDKSGKKELEVDIEYYASLGQMPESEYSLGDDTKPLEELAEQSAQSTDHNHEVTYYEIVDYDGYSCIYADQFCYYYESNKKDEGIGCIVSYAGGYGFEPDSVSVQVQKDLAAAGYEAQERDATESDIFFLPSGDFTCLEYTFKGNTVKFIFEENTLCACLIYGENWSL